MGCQRSNWFDVGWDESAAELERFLTRYPDSANAPQALRLLATSLSVVSQKEPAGQASQALARLRAYASAQLAQSAEPDLVAETYEVLIGALARRSETDEARSCLEEVTAAFGAESKQARRFDDLRARLRAPSGH